MNKFASIDSSILNEVASEVSPNEVGSDDIQALIDDMLLVARGEQGDKKQKTMVGLAAPQIGVSLRVVVIATNSTGMGEAPSLKAYINPVIIEASTETEDGREGCYSTGSVCGVVSRNKTIVVSALDRDGEKITETHEGFVARIFQHEIDHLDGVRFPERIQDDSKLHWVEAEQFGRYRKEWASWKALCPREKWLDLKSGN